MKFICLLFVLIFQNQSFAQVASASIFSEMRSINPAVIGGREFGQYSVGVGMDKIEKYQLLSKDFISGEWITEESDTVITIDDQYFFRGGKGGGLITTELSFTRSNGTKDIRLFYSDDSLDETTISTGVKFTNMELSVGVGKFLGISYSKQVYNYAYKFEFTFDGKDFADDVKEEITGSIIKVGGVLPLGSFRFSSYLDIGSMTTEREQFLVMSGLEKSTTKSEGKTIAMGVGYVTKRAHFEASYEKVLSADYTDNSPVRLSATAEMKIWKLSLGYTGRLYQDGFQDNDKIVYNELVFPSSDDDRLEHIFNFAFGSGKGFSFGGSGFFSKYTAQEENPLVSDTIGEVDTEIKQFGVALKLGYVW